LGAKAHLRGGVEACLRRRRVRDDVLLHRRGDIQLIILHDIRLGVSSV